MNYFKNKNNEIFAYDDEQIEQGYGSDLTQITEAEKDEILAPTDEQLIEQAKAQALTEYETAIEAMIGKVPNTELSSWAKQESEARNLDKPTPMLDTLVISRGLGETKEELATKIIANADAYAVGYAQVLGEYQAKLKELEGNV